MQTTQANLVITNPQTPEMKIYFNGVVVEGVQDLKIDWDTQAPKVVITLTETEMVSAMKSSGISVRRVA